MTVIEQRIVACCLCGYTGTTYPGQHPGPIGRPCVNCANGSMVEYVPSADPQGAVEDRAKLDAELAATRRALMAELGSWRSVEAAVERHRTGRQ